MSMPTLKDNPDVPARAREARDESELNGIANARHDDRNRPGSLLGCHGWWRRPRHDDIHLEPDQLGRELGQPVEPTLRKTIVDNDVLALHQPELT
jgi:hypothetical protein